MHVILKTLFFEKPGAIVAYIPSRSEPVPAVDEEEHVGEAIFKVLRKDEAFNS